MGHRESAQTMRTLMKYIGSGAGNQLGDHQNQPGFIEKHDFRILMIFNKISAEMIKFSEFQYISAKLGTLEARC